MALKNPGVHFRFFLALLALAFSGTSLGACETMKGAGRDIETAGESVQDAAR